MIDNGIKKSISMIKNGVTVQNYESIREMCREVGLDRHAVQVIEVKFTNHKGYKFKVGLKYDTN